MEKMDASDSKKGLLEGMKEEEESEDGFIDHRKSNRTPTRRKSTKITPKMLAAGNSEAGAKTPSNPLKAPTFNKFDAELKKKLVA